jgi:hypothetical protein
MEIRLSANSCHCQGQLQNPQAAIVRNIGSNRYSDPAIFERIFPKP